MELATDNTPTRSLMVDADDLELLNAIGQGDEQAFNRFYEKYKNRFYKYVCKNFAKGLPGMAEDILMNFWVKIYNHCYSSEKDNQKLTLPYLYTILKHEAYDEFRRKKREKDKKDKFALASMLQSPSTNTTQDPSENSLDLQAALYREVFLNETLEQRAMEHLAVFDLWMQGYTEQEIASRCDLTRDKVRGRKKKIKEILTPLYQNQEF